MRQWQGIVLHHSATPDGIVLKDYNAIRQYHIEHNGWKDIGYHYVVEKVNGVYRIEPGRSIDKDGAHAFGFNKTHIGICCVGSFDNVAPSIELYLQLNNLIAVLVNTYKISYNNIIGHRDTYTLLKVLPQKTCPGNKFDIASAIHYDV